MKRVFNRQGYSILNFAPGTLFATLVNPVSLNNHGHKEGTKIQGPCSTGPLKDKTLFPVVLAPQFTKAFHAMDIHTLRKF